MGRRRPAIAGGDLMVSAKAFLSLHILFVYDCSECCCYCRGLLPAGISILSSTEFSLALSGNLSPCFHLAGCSMPRF